MDDVKRLHGETGPQASNVRTLFAAARTAFARDPAQYRALDMHRLILDHVKQIRTAGVRGNQTTFVGELGTLDKQDKAAGALLFKTLAERSSGDAATQPAAHPPT